MKNKRKRPRQSKGVRRMRQLIGIKNRERSVPSKKIYKRNKFKNYE